MRWPLLASALALAVCASHAAAVPIPFKNCGAPGDIISGVLWDASIWPLRGTPGPIRITAIYDGSGKLDRLLVAVLYGVNWIFETPGGLGIVPSGGIVPLPPSLTLTLVSPSPPVPAGPSNITQTFPAVNPGDKPTTIAFKGNIGQAITSANAVFTLSYNGSPGFPQVNDPLGVYHATLDVTEDSGKRVFCIDLTSPLTSFVATSVSAPIPDLSTTMRIVLLAALVAAGLYALRLRLA